MATKRIRRLDARAFRLERLARSLRLEFGHDARSLPEDDWVDTVRLGDLTIRCHPTDPTDPERPWIYTVAGGGDGRIEIPADIVTTEQSIEEKGGNIPEVARRIAGIVADRDAAARLDGEREAAVG